MRNVCITAGLCLTFLQGCGTSGQMEEAQTPGESIAVPAPPPPPPQEFRSRTDTVSAEQKAAGIPKEDESGAPVLIRYLVQVGAFKDPMLADAAHSTAKQRFALTVLNDYNPLVGLYQIRIGFFDTKEEAQTFRDKIKKEFPEDYRDSWIVQIKQ